MKIYKYIAIIAVTLSFASCDRDDDTAVAPQSSNIQVIVEPFTSDSGFVGQVGSSEIDLSFRLTEFTTTYFDSEVVITFQGNDYTIEPEFDNNGDLILSSTVVNVGPTMVNLSAPSIPYNGVVVDQIAVDFDVEVDNRPSNLVVLKGGLDFRATLYNQLPVATPGQVNFLFDWDPNNDAGNDLDLRIRTAGGARVEYSGSVTNYEDVEFQDSEADGMYEVRADSWETIGGTINGIVFAMHPDGTLEIFETDLSAIPSRSSDSEEIVMVKIEKAGSTITLSQ